MPHSYKFADAEHTVVARDDGKSFAWPKHIENVANLNGRIAEDYRREGSPKITPYTSESKAVAATKPKQQTKPPATVESAEAVLAALEEDRRQLVSARAADDAEMAKHAYQSHVLHELGATERLDEISKRAIERDQRLRELDCAIFEARDRRRLAQESEQRAADRQKAAELSAHVDELSQIPAYIERHLADALRGLLAFERGVAELHQKGVAFPSDVQLRLGMVAVLGTWLQQLPRTWFNELAGGVRFLAPAQRKTALSYFAQLEPSLRNAIRAGQGEAERTDTEAA
jgi:hypothetical protein